MVVVLCLRCGDGFCACRLGAGHGGSENFDPLSLAEPNEFENVKDILADAAETWGLGSRCAHVLSLALAMVRCWTMYEQALEAPDPRISAQSMGIAMSQSVRSLAKLAFDLGRGAENEFSPFALRKHVSHLCAGCGMRRLGRRRIFSTCCGV